jgi:hypothetical protein
MTVMINKFATLGVVKMHADIILVEPMQNALQEGMWLSVPVSQVLLVIHSVPACHLRQLLKHP